MVFQPVRDVQMLNQYLRTNRGLDASSLKRVSGSQSAEGVDDGERKRADSRDRSKKSLFAPGELIVPLFNTISD